MFEGKSSYTEFLKSQEGIATNILADRLASLEEDGIITKEKTPDGGEGRHYRLTKKGVELLPTVVEIIAWSLEYGDGIAVSADLLHRLKANKNRLVRELKSKIAREGRSSEPRLKPERPTRRKTSPRPAPKNAISGSSRPKASRRSALRWVSGP